MKRSMTAAIPAAVVPATLATPAGALSRPKRYREYRFQPPERLTPFLATARTMRDITHGGWGPCGM
jgi:hypothetical protein